MKEKKIKEKNLKNAKEWHPIIRKKVGFFANLEEWQEAWNKAETADELTDLLFRGLKIPLNNEEFYEQICFYLEAAYGHRKLSHFFLFGDYHQSSDYRHWTSFGHHTIPELKEIICSNAWKFLCQDFFKDRKDDRGRNEPSWYDRLFWARKIIDKILWFFLEKDNCPVSHSVSDNNEEIAKKFLIKLAEYAWSSSNEGIRKYLVGKRLEVMKILWNIEKLDFLFRKWKHLTRQDLDNLKELALTKSWGSGKHETIEEAALGINCMNVQAARTYIVLDAMLEENARQDEIEEAERNIKEANEVLKGLNV